MEEEKQSKGISTANIVSLAKIVVQHPGTEAYEKPVTKETTTGTECYEHRFSSHKSVDFFSNDRSVELFSFILKKYVSANKNTCFLISKFGTYLIHISVYNDLITSSEIFQQNNIKREFEALVAHLKKEMKNENRN